MNIIRTKNNVPQVYVSESRDFQIFTRVLDFVQNSLKYDIDSILNVTSTNDISEEYLEYLKSKVGFFSNRFYDDETLRKTLSAFPHIIRNKGSELGIEMCINTFLNIVGFRKGYTVSIYNDGEIYDHTIRIGIEGSEINTDILKDMLSYVIPTGYYVEFYFYTSVKSPNTKSVLRSATYILRDTDNNESNLISRVSKGEEIGMPSGESMNVDTYGTVQLATIKNPPTSEGDSITDE